MRDIRTCTICHLVIDEDDNWSDDDDYLTSHTACQQEERHDGA